MKESTKKYKFIECNEAIRLFCIVISINVKLNEFNLYWISKYIFME